MTSQIDVRVPVLGNPRTADERRNWGIAYAEITALQKTLGEMGSPAGIIDVLGYVPYDAVNPAHYQNDDQVTASLDARLSSLIPWMDGAAASGFSNLFSREDHRHPIDTSRYAASNPDKYQSDADVAASLAALLGITDPLMDGIAAVGASTLYSRQDHVHPIDQSRYAASNPLNYQSDNQVAAAVASGVSQYVPLTQKGGINGVATLDASGRVPSIQLPAVSTGTVNYIGGWDPTSNTPPITSGGQVGGVPAPKGNYYVASVSGTFTAIDGITSVSAGDWMLSNGNLWERVQNNTTPHLLLTGGVLTGSLTAPTYVIANTDTWTSTSPLEPDAVWSLRGLGGNVPVLLDSQGYLVVAGLVAYNATINLAADPTTALGAVSKQYSDAALAALYTSTLPLTPTIGGSAGTALTFSRSDHRHPGDPNAVPTNNPVFIGSIALSGSGETWQPSIEPDFLYSFRDTAGNINVAIDYSGLLLAAAINVQQLTATTFSLSGALSSGPITAPSITIQGDAWNDAGLIPDLVGTVRGAGGNIIFGFDALTGEANAVSLNTGALKINGQPLSATVSRAPGDAIDISQPPYNAVGDGLESYTVYATTSGTSLSLVNYTGTGTLAAFDASNMQLTIPFVAHAGWWFQPEHLSYPIHIVNTDTGAVIDSTVTRFQNHTLLLIAGTTWAAFTDANITITLPGFRTSDVGKSMVVEGQGTDLWWAGALNVKTKDTRPYSTYTWMGTITAVADGAHVTVNSSFNYAWSSIPTRIQWGTNDGDAVARAAKDAYNQKLRKIWFAGNKLYLCLNMLIASPGKWTYSNSANPTDPQLLFDSMLWLGDGAKVHVCDTAGQQWRHRPAQATNPPPGLCEKRVHGRMSFPRCDKLQTINLLIIGDSQGAFNPEGQSAVVMPGSRYVEEFIAQNPGKKINVYNVAIGGATYNSFASPNSLINNNTNAVQYWACPKPIAGTWKWYDFLTNINRSGAGPAIVPDAVISMFCGGNESYTLDVLSMIATINMIRALPHADGFGPTDVIMQTDAAARGRYNVDAQDGIILPDPWTRFNNWEYATTMIRGFALNRGYGLLDQAALVERVCFGFDQSHRIQRAVASQNITPTQAVPVALGTQCREFSFWMTFPATTDLAAWQAIGQLDITLSYNTNNRLMIRLGANNNFWLAQSADGKANLTSVTMTLGSTAIAVGAPTTFNSDFQLTTRWNQLYLSSSPAALTTAMNGMCVVGPFGNGGGQAYDTARLYIDHILDANNARLVTCGHDYADIGPVTNKAISVAPNLFTPIDAVAQSDVWMVLPDGSIFQTKIVGYTDLTHAVMRDPAPMTVNGAVIPMFIGIMGIPWTDTGRGPNQFANTGVMDVEISRNYLNWGYSEDLIPIAATELNFWHFVEKFGMEYNPVFLTWGASQQLNLSNIYVDGQFQFTPTCTPGELRSMGLNDGSMWGGGGHAGSRFRTEIVDPICAANNFSTSS